MWRIQNGELPEELQTNAFWLLIGTIDFLKDDFDYCSEDVVIMGIKRVVGEIESRKPEAMIVINGLLPRAVKGSIGKLYRIDHKITIMDAIDNVNKKLKMYCDVNDNLFDFDAKDIFININDKIEGGKMSQFILNSLIAYYLSPPSNAKNGGWKSLKNREK